MILTNCNYCCMFVP